VKQPIVRSARGIELLPEERAADWQDIRVKHDRNRCQSVNSVKDRIPEKQRYGMIDKNYTPFRSNVLRRRGIYLAIEERRLWQRGKDVRVENNLLNNLGFNLCVAPQSPVVRLVAYFRVMEVVKTEVLRNRVKELEWTRQD